MSTRRDFLAQAGALAGIACTGCEPLPLAHAQPRRREVSLGGGRIRTIDVHAHAVIPEALTLMKQKLAPVYAHPLAERLKRMDEQGIDMQALSINPTWYGLERDLVAKVIELQNEKLAELCASQPDRFVAFASVALQYPDLAAQQLEHAVKKLNLRGAGIGGSVEGQELSDPKFHPFWAKAEELGALVFTSEALRHLTAQVGASQIVMGSDDPFGWTKTAVDHILGTPELTDEQRRAMLGETAAKLLRLEKI